jgi:hypothetical protein
MIHIIGTAHERTQYWSDAIRRGEAIDTNSEIVRQFEQYVRDAARSFAATTIAEELSQQCVEERDGGISVCKKVADDLGLHHLFCDPDRDERQKLDITTTDQRESIWVSRVAKLAPNEPRLSSCVVPIIAATFGRSSNSEDYKHEFIATTGRVGRNSPAFRSARHRLHSLPRRVQRCATKSHRRNSTSAHIKATATSGIADIKVKVYSFPCYQPGRAEVHCSIRLSGSHHAIGGQQRLTFHSWSIRERLCAPRIAIDLRKGE